MQRENEACKRNEPAFIFVSNKKKLWRDRERTPVRDTLSKKGRKGERLATEGPTLRFRVRLRERSGAPGCSKTITPEEPKSGGENNMDMLD